ncbi:MAG: glycosyltransferase family 2 protein [Bacteroidaceae bacterium]|nr:glycosyltransferase family 2 protein [Bacteroidaceae bacterium]
MKVSVVILNWNAEHLLRQFLPSVVHHSEGEGIEVVVADNGSTDGSLALLASEFPTVRIIALDQNYGFAEGYNRALAHVDAEYAVLLNDDVEVTPGWLTPLATFMDTHPGYAACQPKLMSWHERDRFEYAGACGGYLDRYGYPFCRGRIFNTIETDHGQYDESQQVNESTSLQVDADRLQHVDSLTRRPVDSLTRRPVDLLWATGACLFIRMADYRAAGGLDGRFFAHMEEVDLCWRLRCRGRRIACVTDSVVYHVGGASLQAGSPRKTFLNFRNNLLMLYKNLPPRELRPVLRVRALLDVVAAFTFLLKGEGRNFFAVFRARRAFRRLKPDFIASRQENIAAATAAGNPALAVAERRPWSILVQYHLRHRHTYDQLKKKVLNP